MAPERASARRPYVTNAPSQYSRATNPGGTDGQASDTRTCGIGPKPTFKPWPSTPASRPRIRSSARRSRINSASSADSWISHALPVIGESTPMMPSAARSPADRPEGQRLLMDAEAGRFGTGPGLPDRPPKCLQGAPQCPRHPERKRGRYSLGDRAVRQRDTYRRVPVPTPRFAGRTGEVHDRRAHGPRAQPGSQRRRLHGRADPTRIRPGRRWSAHALCAPGAPTRHNRGRWSQISSPASLMVRSQ